ncbi:MAG: alginate export family protein [Bacteroidales bacterium]|nr:alginate export family protein [Bacteroidales bacterium]MBN2762613.1 alginate export family protein [Bacteroidales bacterium]
MPLSSQAQFKLSAEIRPRIEYRNGYKTFRTDSSNPAFVASQRTRLTFDYNTEKIRSSVSLQDARIWGETPAKADAPSIHIYQAWIEPKVADNLWIRAGRQMLRYDNEKLLGRSNWGDVSLSHDAAVVRFEPDIAKIHLGGAYNNDKSKNFESEYTIDFYKTLAFLWISKEIGPGITGSLIALADGHQKEGSDTRVFQRYTYGLYLVSAFDSSLFNFKASFYKQNGKNQTGTKINAFNAEASLLFHPVKSIDFIAAVDYYSGNDLLDTLDQTENAFGSVYNTAHSVLGYMDYFTSMPNHTKGAGLIDFYLRMNTYLPRKISLETTLHYFMLSNKLPDPAYSTLQAADKYLGTEIDLLFKWQVTKDINLTAGYCTMFGSKTLEILKGGAHEKYADWAFIMLTFKPVLFSK